MTVWLSWDNPDGSKDEDYSKAPGRATERAELERLGWLDDDDEEEDE